MDPLFDRVVLVGAGLLGASLGLAMQASGAARHITGVGRRQQTLDTALSLGAIHEATLDLAGVAADADCIIIATPAATVLEALDIARAASRPSAVILDVASTKAAICAHAANLWPAPRRFVGCHPMAGSEKSGPEHASASLYNNSVCFIEESPDLDPEAVRLVRELWQRSGARVVNVQPALHDVILASTSHIPHIMATLLATSAVERGAAREFAGNGFRDMTRLAEGSPEMWRDITLTNREAVMEGLEVLRGQLNDFLTAVERSDAQALMQFFEAGREARRQVFTP
ncbi:MAG: prephenate dehydrogenase/arogenate dehydrogenase family protein [Candidatus Hydrogenedentes bacterium]|nr:prephenate dehydrogenase/arogenate dehydrogenase family protein [Candidatus Hydrogenedentota bacterium]